jgi:aromatic-L-amino-acid decarboxylase
MEKMDSFSLDPSDWTDLRVQGHRMLDDMFEFLEHLRDRPVWQPIAPSTRALFRTSLPHSPTGLAEVHATFLNSILPFAAGNAHPGFMGWVHGGGTAVGMLAEMLAAGLNANLGGRDQIPVEVERQVALWARELFGFPDTSSGIFVTGTSMANLMAVWVARTVALGGEVRSNGLQGQNKQLVGYTSAAAHGCIARAFDFAGLGTAALRLIPTDAAWQMDVAALARAIAADRAAGLLPFCVVATAGSVDVGAIDDLAAIATLTHQENLWFHVDGAYGALAMMAPDLAPRLAGIERADSIAFDFHKWAQVPYDAGFLLVRDTQHQLDTFMSPAAYLRRDERGLAAGSPWPCDLGPDLSRGFRALKTWFTLNVYGTDRLGQVISGTCELARYLGARVEATPELELLAPVSLNIVCFRHRGEELNRLNADIVATLQEQGLVAPSTTTLRGQLAIRAAIVNHRTTTRDIDALIAATLAAGAAHHSL